MSKERVFGQLTFWGGFLPVELLPAWMLTIEPSEERSQQLPFTFAVSRRQLKMQLVKTTERGQANQSKTF